MAPTSNTNQKIGDSQSTDLHVDNTNQNIGDSPSTDLHVDNTTSSFFTIYTRKL